MYRSYECNLYVGGGKTGVQVLFLQVFKYRCVDAVDRISRVIKLELIQVLVRSRRYFVPPIFPLWGLKLRVFARDDVSGCTSPRADHSTIPSTLCRKNAYYSHNSPLPVNSLIKSSINFKTELRVLVILSSRRWESEIEISSTFLSMKARG